MACYRIEDLLQLMRDLRSPDHGCPWDKKQTFRSLIPYTLEEAYEVADAIEGEDMQELRLELGDLLFQVVFYSQLANEQGCFDFDAVVSGITEKLLRRHPHVFPDATLGSAGSAEQSADEHQIKQNWERIKQEEKTGNTSSSILDDVPRALPAVMRAFKLQKRAAKVGFDWPHISGVVDKLHEEVAELEEVIGSAEKERILDELGDILFSCVNLARHLEIDPESALRSTIEKFEARFRHLETEVKDNGGELTEMSLDQLEQAWQRAKKAQQ